jgi:hypothetical protein
MIEDHCFPVRQSEILEIGMMKRIFSSSSSSSSKLAACKFRASNSKSLIFSSRSGNPQFDDS